MSKIDLAYAFGLKPEKAIEYFKSKGYVFSWDWHEVWQEAHTKAFTVAKVTRMDILQDIRDSVQEALDTGITFAEFRKNLEPTLKAKGWWGKQEMVNEQTGEVSEVQLGSPYRLRTIFDANLDTAYNVGRYRSQMENVETRPFWEYVAVMDARTRPSHAALNGKTFRADDPFWDSFYPPNGWRCRCRVRAYDSGDLQDKGLRVEHSLHHLSSKEVDVGKSGQTATVAVYKGRDELGAKFTVSPDAGWSYNPGKVDWKPDMNKYDPQIKAL